MSIYTCLYCFILKVMGVTCFVCIVSPLPLFLFQWSYERGMRDQQQIRKRLRHRNRSAVYALRRLIFQTTLSRTQLAVCFKKFLQHGFGQRQLSGGQLHQGGL